MHPSHSPSERRNTTPASQIFFFSKKSLFFCNLFQTLPHLQNSTNWQSTLRFVVSVYSYYASVFLSTARGTLQHIVWVCVCSSTPTSAPILIKLHHSLTHSDTLQCVCVGVCVTKKDSLKKPEKYVFLWSSRCGRGGGGRCRRSTVCAKQFNTLRHFCLFFFSAGKNIARDSMTLRL